MAEAALLHQTVAKNLLYAVGHSLCVVVGGAAVCVWFFRDPRHLEPMFALPALTLAVTCTLSIVVSLVANAQVVGERKYKRRLRERRAARVPTTTQYPRITALTDARAAAELGGRARRIPKCAACHERPSIIAAVPCGHQMWCAHCVLTLIYNAGREFVRCSVCRADALYVIDVSQQGVEDNNDDGDGDGVAVVPAVQ
jgi:LSD1 subclass zinc finger protein